VPQGSILGPLLFLFYINDLDKVLNNDSKLVLFADDTSIIVSNSNLANFKNYLTFSFKQLKAWFNINLLSLNYNKTQYIQFTTIDSQTIQFDISYNRYITNNTNTRFLGTTVDSSLSWKHHTDGLVVKLGTACYAIRYVRPFVSKESLRKIYYSYFHVVTSYGIFFWGIPLIVTVYLNYRKGP
jgi:hypothetical protein